MPLPTFLIIGAAKAGTSSLYHYLQQHPEIFMSPLKEPRFFTFEDRAPRFSGPLTLMNSTSVTDLAAYRALFDGVRGEKAIGEASAIYLYYYETTPERIQRHVPDAKLIVMLRNPVERAYSSFVYLVAEGYETLDFERALEEEERRILDHWAPMFHYVRRGRYLAQVRRYLEVFGANQVGIFLYEDFARDPGDVVRDIFRFLGVQHTYTPDLSVRYNVSGIPRYRLLHAALRHLRRAKPFFPPAVSEPVSRIASTLRRRTLVAPPPMSTETRKRLRELYMPDVLGLQDLIGRDLSRWLE